MEKVKLHSNIFLLVVFLFFPFSSFLTRSRTTTYNTQVNFLSNGNRALCRYSVSIDESKILLDILILADPCFRPNCKIKLWIREIERHRLIGALFQWYFVSVCSTTTYLNLTDTPFVKRVLGTICTRLIAWKCIDVVSNETN